MDKLLDAIIRAINTGTDLAWPALVMYFILQIVLAAKVPLAVYFVVSAARAIILGCVKANNDSLPQQEAVWKAKENAIAVATNARHSGIRVDKL